MPEPLPPAYAPYLRLDELLNVQSPPDFAAGHERGVYRELIHHDEMLFIIVHQVYELWFKQILHDLGLARDLLGRPGVDLAARPVPEEDIPRITELLGRVNEILRLLHSQFTVLETMPTVHFLAFRDQLLPASGFQSVQWRELETLAGLKDDERLGGMGKDYQRMLSEEQRERLAKRRAEMSLSDAVFSWLARAPMDKVFPNFSEVFIAVHERYQAEQERIQANNPNLSPQARENAVVHMHEEHEQLCQYLRQASAELCQAHAAFLFITSYRDLPLLRWPYTLIESVIEFEERFRLLRYRHTRMVERIIGRRVGTGGSLGVSYLDRVSESYRIFGELLEGRTYLLNPALLPPVPGARLFTFRSVDSDV